MKKRDAQHNGRPKAVEQLQERPTEFLIVGIGASAGGIQALQQFFRQVPANSHIAYVVILHLSPDHDSQLAAVLQRETTLPVLQVNEKVEIKPDHIYVVPPDRHLAIEDSYIAVLPNLQLEERRAPVDIFFRTLADQHGPRAISVILSGTGANGSMGLKRIKERGGATYVQNPREAEFNEMPRNSIATELVDEVLNVAEIPARIIAYRDSIGKVQIVEETEKRPETQQVALRDIFTQLKVRTGHDFSNYKRPTLLRRVERRINVHNLPDLPSYSAFLHEHPDETHALLKDLLISVTNFFRDSKAFNGVEQDILPALFAGKTSEDQIRIWVAGCATGEEAYSLAMLCAEQALSTFDAPKVQIFATDIDESAIATAREGFYTLNDAADVSSERLRRFFAREGDGYRVRREIREMILFAHHNFLKDPPFSKLDLVTCRNVLIYLNNTAQERVLETFHFALRPKGYLFLGTSESVDGAGDLYTLYSRDHHIFQAREVTARSYPVPESVPQFHFPKNDLLQKPDERESRVQRISFGELHQKMLEQYAPPSVVINEEYDIVHMTERAGKYFEFAGGEPTQNLLKLIRPQIRLELRSALYQAVQSKAVVEARSLKLPLNGEQQSLDIQVRPALDDGESPKGFILVIFKPAQEVLQDGATIKMASDEPMARQLEEELIGLKAQLRNSIETHEYRAEELKASNEELQAMNEELRSAAEELETSKEELQSINEELRTVNQELKVKIDETTVNSNNLQNLVNSANVGTIFLDRSFAIRLFTPATLDIFNLKSGDYGRPVTDITNKLQYDGLLRDAETVLEKLTVIEREVPTSDNRFYMMRLLPYRTSDDRINGVVITFFDVTARRESEAALRRTEEKYRLQLEQEVEVRTAELRESKELFEATINSSLDMIQVFEAIRNDSGDIIDFRWILNNQAAEKVYGDVIGKSLLTISPGVAEAGIFDTFKRVVNTRLPDVSERHYAHEQFDGWFYQSSVKLGDGVVTITIDITERKNAGEELLRVKEELAQRATEKYVTLFNSIDEGFHNIELIYDKAGKLADYRFLQVNPAFERQTGLKNAAGKLGSEIAPNTELYWLDIYDDVARTGNPRRFENYNQATGRWYNTYASRIGGEGSCQLAIVFDDITERKLAEEVLKDYNTRLEQEVADRSRELRQNYALVQTIYDTTLIGMSVFTPVTDEQGSITDFKIVMVNKKIERSAKRSDMVGKLYSELYPGIKQIGLFDLMVKTMETGETGKMEYHYNYEGMDSWYSTMFVKGEDTIVSTNLDITERKIAEEKRLRAFVLLEQSEELAGIGSWDYDLLTGNFIWSDGMYRLFNAEKGKEVKPEIYLQYATADCREIAAHIVGHIEKGDSEFEESLTIDVGKTVKVLKLKATVIKNDEGHPVRVLGVDMDVTATREAEEKLRRLEAEQQMEIFRVTLRTQEDERRRISESLHNGLGQLLYGIKISMSELSPAIAVRDDKRYVSSKQYTEELLTDAIKETRRISHELMPMVLNLA